MQSHQKSVIYKNYHNKTLFDLAGLWTTAWQSESIFHLNHLLYCEEMANNKYANRQSYLFNILRNQGGGKGAESIS